MCDYCDINGPGKYIVESEQADENGDILLATIEPEEALLTIGKYSENNPFAGGEVLLQTMINFCPMCGEDIYRRRATN